MNEKEVDAYLSLASLCHLLLVGALGGLVTEIFAESPRFEVLFLSGFVTALLGIVLTLLYSIAFGIARNKRNKS